MYPEISNNNKKEKKEEKKEKKNEKSNKIMTNTLLMDTFVQFKHLPLTHAARFTSYVNELQTF